MLIECKNIAFKVYTVNREENRFLKNTVLMKLSNFIWLYCLIAVILLFCQKDEDFDREET